MYIYLSSQSNTFREQYYLSSAKFMKKDILFILFFIDFYIKKMGSWNSRPRFLLERVFL